MTELSTTASTAQSRGAQTPALDAIDEEVHCLELTWLKGNDAGDKGVQARLAACRLEGAFSRGDFGCTDVRSKWDPVVLW